MVDPFRLLVRVPGRSDTDSRGWSAGSSGFRPREFRHVSSPVRFLEAIALTSLRSVPLGTWLLKDDATLPILCVTGRDRTHSPTAPLNHTFSIR